MKVFLVGIQPVTLHCALYVGFAVSSKRLGIIIKTQFSDLSSSIVQKQHKVKCSEVADLLFATIDFIY